MANRDYEQMRERGQEARRQAIRNKGQAGQERNDRGQDQADTQDVNNTGTNDTNQQ